MALLAGYGAAFAITSLAACRPFEFNWDKTIDGGECIDVSKFYGAQVILGVVFDVVVVVLPMPMLWGLQMKIQKKVALTCVFGMGIIVCIISAFRTVYNYDTGLQKRDYPTYAGIAIILAVFECNLSIICVSLPVMQPVLKTLPQLVKSVFSRSSTHHSSSKRPMWPSKDQRIPRFGGDGDPEDAKFKRLYDHVYPLGSTQLPYEGGSTQNTIESTREAGRQIELEDLPPNATQPHSAIAVTRAWEVSAV
ncbi:MAG: hypothetical protein Q9222_006291 [Ikaeria aurantiellina]